MTESTSAVLSACGSFRYRLVRTWDAETLRVLWVMLNPSTADATTDDPTIRRCCGFARSWGYGGIEVVNLFALRATDPAQLNIHPTPVGPENDRHILSAAMGESIGLIVCGWGQHGHLYQRDREVLQMLQPHCSLHVLSWTMAGQPRHPLYLKGDLQPTLLRSQDRESG